MRGVTPVSDTAVMTRGAKYSENFSPMSLSSLSLKSNADNCTWIQLSSNELKDNRDLCGTENMIDEIPETNDMKISGFSDIELRKDSGIRDHDLESTHLGEIYPETQKITNKKPCVFFCFGSMRRPKLVVLMILLLALVLLLVFFAFAPLPLRLWRIPIIPLTTAPPTTLGTIRVLLLGKLLSFFCNNLPV